MFFRNISWSLSRYLFYFSLVLCIPLTVAAFYEFALDPLAHAQVHGTAAFFKTIGICLLSAFFFRLLGKKESALHRKESILLVVLIWLITPAISALPFLFTKTLTHPVDAYFEAMSGLTTTGSTILHAKAYDATTGREIPLSLSHPKDPSLSYQFYGTVEPIRSVKTDEPLHTGIEAVGKALLFWRSFLQWLGGMGIVVLFIAVLPALSMGGKFLFETEAGHLSKEGLTPRIKQTASLLWKIYLGLTAMQVLLLMSTSSIPFFDALNLSFSTLSTGGFSIRNEGLAAYNSGTVNTVVALFMLLGSLNFTLYFYALRGKVYRIYEPEFFAYIFILAAGSLVLGCILWSADLFSFPTALRFGAFQALSSQSSTGFSTSSYSLWPFSAQFLMLILLFIGGMSGSTSGGMKVARYWILFRVVMHKIESLFRPHSVRCLKVGNKEIADKTAMTVLIFFSIATGLMVLGAFLFILDGIDPQTALGLAVSMINNGGIALGAAVSAESCAFLPTFSKLLSIFWMLLGRLEFFALLVLFVPAFWKN